jgi:hypothetical protein
MYKEHEGIYNWVNGREERIVVSMVVSVFISNLQYGWNCLFYLASMAESGAYGNNSYSWCID